MPHAVRPNAGLIWLTGRMTPHNGIPPTWNALTAPTGAFRSGLALGTQHLARWITPSLARPQVDELPARSVAPVTRDLMEADETVCPRTRKVSMYEPEGDGSAAGRRSRECADLGHEADSLDGYEQSSSSTVSRERPSFPDRAWCRACEAIFSVSEVRRDVSLFVKACRLER